MPEDNPKNALPQPASATAAGARRDPFRRSNLIGGDDAASDAFDSGADRPEPFGPSELDPFTVRGT